jgi:hypothetical protein
MDGGQAAADEHEAARHARGRGSQDQRAHGPPGGGRVEAAAAGGVRAADVPPGRSCRGGLLRGAGRRGWTAAEGVDVPAAADVLGARFCVAVSAADQVCFLDGHVRAFAHLGSAPHRAAYDNLKPAVTRVLVGSERELARFWRSLLTTYSSRASRGRGPDTTKAASKREARACAGSIWCRYPRAATSRASAAICWSVSTGPQSSDGGATGAQSPSCSPRSCRRCCRFPDGHSAPPRPIPRAFPAGRW